MNVLPDEILLHIMIFLGIPDMNKIKMYINKAVYNNIINDMLLEYIMAKSIKKNPNSNHVLIEINPRRKMSLITHDNSQIKKEIKRSFLENTRDMDSFNQWIKTYYLKNSKKNI